MSALASAQGAIAIGSSQGVAGAKASGANSVAIGGGDNTVVGASATAADSVAIGRLASSTHATSVALGKGATTTAINQIRLGTATEDVNIPGTLTLSGGAVTAGAWTAHTPQIDQGVTTNIAKTVNYSNWARVGKMITWNFRLSLTAAGTAGTRVSVTLPATAASATAAAVGSGLIYDASVPQKFISTMAMVTTTTIAFETDSSTTDAWGASPSVALASGDVLMGSVTYEAA